MNAVGINDQVAGSRGCLFIVSAPSGGGKTTLCKAVLNRFPDIRYSVSYTTRKPRKDEQDGVDYHFTTRELFKEKLKSGQWAEWAEVHGQFYGTSAEFIEKVLSSGHDILLDIDIQGTLQISRRYPESVMIFIMPPSMDVLRDRLEARGTDSGQEISRRLLNAEKEILKKDLYHHVIINDRLSVATNELIAIIEKYHLKRS